MINKAFGIRKPSFIRGMARVIDICATLNNYNYLNNADEVDYCATKSDWVVVGKDIEIATINNGRNFNGGSRKSNNKLGT